VTINVINLVISILAFVKGLSGTCFKSKKDISYAYFLSRFSLVLIGFYDGAIIVNCLLGNRYLVQAYEILNSKQLINSD
jgi:hypothetical protein